MSEEAASAAPKSSGSSKGPLLLALVNTLVVLGAAGMLYYTKVMFKRPAITEDTERKRLEAEHAKPPTPLVPGLITFEPVTVNIESQPGKQAEGADTRLHYATVGFSLDIRDIGQKELLEEVRPVIMDKLLSILAKKPFHELTSVQGRYVMRTQILDLVNGLTATLPSRPIAVPAPPKAAGGHGEEGGEGHGEGHGEAKPEGEGHGEGHGEGGEGHAEKKEVKAPPHGPPVAKIFPEGLVSNVYFTQFIVQ